MSQATPAVADIKDKQIGNPHCEVKALIVDGCGGLSGWQQLVGYKGAVLPVRRWLMSKG